MSKKEKAFAEELNAFGLNFERNCKDLPGTPDVVFRQEKLAVFFHGCFWHSHHCQAAIESREWQQNLQDIKNKDQLALLGLRERGFQTLIIWECEWHNHRDWVVNLISDRLYLSQYRS